MKIVFIILLIIIGGKNHLAQDDQLKRNFHSQSQSKLAGELLDTIEQAIADSHYENISPYLSEQTYLSFLNGVNGYYSSNQAYYILEDFFKEYKVISFNLNEIRLNTLTPFATGICYYDNKGNRDEANIYITLKLTGTTWKITQMTIN